MQNEERASPVNFNAGKGGKEHDWGGLPLYAIERILSFLNLRDRLQASIICKSWGEAFECPDLWTAPVLVFSMGHRCRPCFNPQNVVERFGRYFRKLTVCCRKKRQYFFELVANFFHSMEIEGVQLEGFRMPRLMVIAQCFDSTQANVSAKVIDFLRSQTCLATVNFNDGNVNPLAGLEILENLAAENVHHLMLQNFFNNAQEIESSTRFMNAICRFPHLRSLSVNYAYLTGDLLTCLAVSLEGHLELFELLIDEAEFLYSVTVDSWGFLLDKCPQMQVHVRIELTNLWEVHIAIPYLLYPVLPLKSLQYVIRRTWERNIDDFVFDYLRDKFCHTIRDFEFDFQGLLDETFQWSLVVMIRSCPFLENLTVRIRYPYFSIQRFFDVILGAVSQLKEENGIVNLKRLRVAFLGMTIERRRMRPDLLATYVPRFKGLGVQLKITMKKMKISTR